MKAVKRSNDTVSILDLEIPILDAATLATALEKMIATNLLDSDLSEGERRVVMETLAERLVRETMAVHDMHSRLCDQWRRDAGPLRAVVPS